MKDNFEKEQQEFQRELEKKKEQEAFDKMTRRTERIRDKETIIILSG